MKDCCKEKRATHLLSSSIVDGPRENRFKTQQERFGNKNSEDREEGGLGGYTASDPRLFKKS